MVEGKDLTDRCKSPRHMVFDDVVLTVTQTRSCHFLAKGHSEKLSKLGTKEEKSLSL